MKVGDRIVVRVTAVNDSGVFVEHAGRPGIVSVVELTWNEIGQDRHLPFVDVEELEVIVMAVGPDSFGASLRECRPEDNPWKHATLHAGAAHWGEVRVIHDFGVFVNLEIGLVARVESKAVNWSVGQRVEVVLSDVRRDERGLRRLHAEPGKTDQARGSG